MSSSFEPNAFLPRKAPPSQPPPGFVPAKIAAPCPAFKAPPAAQLIKIVFQAQLVYSGGPNIVTFSGSVSTASTARMLGHARVALGFCTWAWAWTCAHPWSNPFESEELHREPMEHLIQLAPGQSMKACRSCERFKPFKRAWRLLSEWLAKQGYGLSRHRCHRTRFDCYVVCKGIGCLFHKRSWWEYRRWCWTSMGEPQLERREGQFVVHARACGRCL